MSFPLPNMLRNLFSRGSAMNPDEPVAPAQQASAEKPAEPMGEQIIFDDEERNLIAQKIEEDIESDKIANQVRQNKNAMYQDDWRNSLGNPKKSDGTANFNFPLIPIQVLQKMASEHQSLFGEDASVTAVPTRPTEAERVAKAGLFMRWVVFSAMEIVRRWTVFSYRRLMFGKAFAILSYTKKYYDHPTKGRVLYQQAPNFELIDADDVFTPAEDAEDANGLSHFAYRYYATPDELLLGEEEQEIYQGIRENWDEILDAARDTNQRQDTSGTGQQKLKEVKDRAAGVDPSAYRQQEGFIEVFAWFGRHRMLKNEPPEEVATEGLVKDYANSDIIPGEPLVREDTPAGEVVVPEKLVNADRPRELRQRDLVIRWAPSLRGVGNLRGIIGAQDLAELFPDTPTKRPIYESGLGVTGEYWPMGLPEMLWSIKQELTVNENLQTQGGQYSVGPFGAYRPASGANPDVIKIQPGIMIPSDNPQEDIRFFNITWNPQHNVLKQQNMLALVERLLGNLDASSGNQQGRTFGQKTARGTLALLERGDLRVNFDTSFLLLDFGKLLKRLWELCAMHAPPSQFFRVTGEDAEGLLKNTKIENGFATMTAEEFGGEFDFELKPATGIHAKEAQKDDLLQLFALLMQLQIFQVNANATWKAARDICKKFGIALEKYMPEPQPPEMSIDPKEEWLMMLRGEEVHVSPIDDDQKHLIRHNMDFEKMGDAPPEEQDVDAMFNLDVHVQEHLAQIEAKRAQQAQMAALLQHVAALAGGAQPGGGGKGEGGPAMPQVGATDPMMAETMGAQAGPGMGAGI
jgi:hypothetical protein